ncbi:MAG: thioredoxin family protein [Coriobacteriia bacterium]
MKRTVSVVLAMMMAGALLAGLAGCGEATTEEKAPLHFIQFFDPNCPFCQAMEPTVEKLQNEYAGRIYKFEIIDVSTTEGLADADEYGVFITPTFVLLDADGNELDRLAGAASEENMMKFIDRGIADVTGESAGPRDEIPTTGGTEAGSE